MDYVLAVMGKYLQMLVAYSISKEDPDQVADHFEQFNKDFDQLCQAFKEVTNQTFQAGQEVQMPMAPLKPILREPKAELGLSDEERVKLQQFLERHNLQELLAIFLKEGGALEDVFDMTDKEMKDLGIQAYGPRKRLLKVIEGVHASASVGQVGSLHLGETQKSSDSTRCLFQNKSDNQCLQFNNWISIL